MVQTVTVPNVGDLEFPDGMSQEEMASAIQKNFPQIHQGASQVPSTPPISGSPEEAQNPTFAENPTIAGAAWDTIKGITSKPFYDENGQENALGRVMHPVGSAIEAAATVGVNAIPTIYQTVNAGGQAMLNKWLKGQDTPIEDVNRQISSGVVYKPEDPLTQQYLQNIGKVAEPFAGLPIGSVEGQIIGETAAPSAQVARNVIGQANIKTPISGAIGAVKHGLTEGVDAFKNVGKNPLQIEQEKTNFIKSQLEAGKVNKDLAGKMLEGGSVVNNPLAKKVISQGFDEGFVSAIDQAAPETRAKILRQVRISEQGKKDPLFGSANRPSDVVGDSLAERIKFLKSENRDAGTQIDVVANNQLKGKPVNYQPALDKLHEDLDSAGISVNENGVLNFKGSDLEFSPGDKKLISDIYSRAKTINGNDAYRVHKLKRLIDTTVDYGKGSQGGITSGGERIVKDFRSAVDSSLDNAFEDYNAANTRYSDTINDLNNFQKAAGSSIDIFGENADKALGSRARSLLSNAQKRVELADSIKAMEDTARKYGANFKDDILTQVLVANVLDKKFGAAAKTSLLGDLEIAGGAAMRGDATNASISALKAAKNKLTGVNDEASYKALKELLMRKKEQ